MPPGSTPTLPPTTPESAPPTIKAPSSTTMTRASPTPTDATAPTSTAATPRPRPLHLGPSPGALPPPAPSPVPVVDQLGDPSAPTGTIFSGTINMANTILGSGMLAMPYAISSVGLALGLVLVLVSGLAAAFGLWLLTHVARHLAGSDRARGPRTPAGFFALSTITYPTAAVYFDAAIAIKCFGVATSYLIVIGDLMPEVVRGLLNVDNGNILVWRSFWILVSSLPIVPLSFAHRLDSLRHTSMVALLAVVYLVGMVIYFFAQPDFNVTPGEIVAVRLSLDFFKTLPIFVFAFTCHQNILAVYNELGDNAQSQVNVVISSACSAALIVYYVIGVLGYLQFGDGVAGNIITMYPVTPVVTFGRLALAILFVFSYPIQAHPCRTSLTKVLLHVSGPQPPESDTPTERSPLLPTSPSYASVEQDDPRPAGQASHSTQTIPVPTAPRRRWWFADASAIHVALTTGIVVLSYSIALVVQSLDTVLAVVGATGSTTICYILPGVFYYKIYERKPWTWVKCGAVVMAVPGCVIMACC
ncbi:hypothetical protein AMAG_15092 [Allomyces macrogynus ATCC 38327]|uniref:Amino acid transporter transmembrane domain-containing protein n=1 Tax=Allomyces macrogynus (strain ATCC 38327) TaxID=578462 RepID=A0A0L0T5U2_ALLM3|nr:hypothetical protein AMAG_15092 [Allomyces macrogynus ATCC 38327]|eukprot:KNE70117.1 hypothetical protein AMAG_15092 [Allomyces macrogynus ATCC 38327]